MSALLISAVVSKVLEEEREELVAKATPPEPAEEEQPAVTSVRLGQWVEQHRQNLEDKEHQVSRTDRRKCYIPGNEIH